MHSSEPAPVGFIGTRAAQRSPREADEAFASNNVNNQILDFALCKKFSFGRDILLVSFKSGGRLLAFYSHIGETLHVACEEYKFLVGFRAS